MTKALHGKLSCLQSSCILVVLSMKNEPVWSYDTGYGINYEILTCSDSYAWNWTKKNWYEKWLWLHLIKNNSVQRNYFYSVLIIQCL